MSRYAIDPPDEDRYSDKPLDAADEPQDGEPFTPVQQDALDGFFGVAVQKEALSAVIDPAEHAAHALIDALATLEKEIAINWDLERANTLREMMRRLLRNTLRVSDDACDRIDAILERRR